MEINSIPHKLQKQSYKISDTDPNGQNRVNLDFSVTWFVCEKKKKHIQDLRVALGCVDAFNTFFPFLNFMVDQIYKYDYKIYTIKK